MRTLISTLTTFLACLALSCCSSGPSSPDSTTRSAYQLPDTITLTASAVRDEDNGTVIEGTTNLPFNTKLGVELLTGSRATAEDMNVFVDRGKYHSVAFRKGTAPLSPGRQRIHIFSYFNTNWQSPSVLKLVGMGGKNLKPSAVIHSEDPQLIDGDNRLDFTVELVIPPLVTIPVKTPETLSAPTLSDRAIQIVKKAVLVVDGRRSSMSVEDGAHFFFSAPGVHMGNGWSATPINGESFNVALDFINMNGSKEEHDTAIWEVNVVTKKVLYRNKYAKGFSWIPDY